MIKAVLLDDELHCTKTLEILLKSHCPQVQIQKIFNHPLEAIEYLKSNSIGLLEQKVSGNEQLQMLMDIMSSQSKKVNKIALPTSEGLEFVNIAEIIRCESDSNYTKIILDGLPYIIVSKTLKEMTDLLGELDFVRVHNSHLINPTHISKYIKAGGGALILTDNVEIPISRQKKDNIMELIKAIK